MNKIRKKILALALCTAMVLSLISVPGQVSEAASIEDALPMDDLSVWFSADQGVTTNADGTVSEWISQVGSLSAVQTSSSSQPTVVEDGYAGQPVISFDGVDDYLSFTKDFNGMENVSIVIVSAYYGDDYTNEKNAAVFFNEVSGWSKVYISSQSGIATWGFGTGQSSGHNNSYDRSEAIGEAYSTTISVKEGTTERLYVDGTEVKEVTGKFSTISGVETTGAIGRANTEDYTQYDIAEILIYDKTLTESEIAGIQTYVDLKYAVGNVTDVEIESSATEMYVGGTLTLSAKFTPANAEDKGVTWTCETPELATISDSGFVEAKAVGNATFTVTTDDGGYTDSITITIKELDIPQDGLSVWLSASELVTADASGNVSVWGNKGTDTTFEATQTNSSQTPTLVEDAFNGWPVISFDGVYDNMDIVKDFNGMSEVTIVAVSAYQGDESTKNDINSPLLFFNESSGWGKVWMTPVSTGLGWGFGTGTSNQNATTVSRTTSSLDDLSVSITIKDGSTEYAYSNGELLSTVTGRTTTIANTYTTGKLCQAPANESAGTTTQGLAYDIAELFIYDRALTEDEVEALQAYFNEKYQLEEMTDLLLDEDEVIIKPGETATLTASIKPTTATNLIEVEWSSSNEDVATVDQDGVITAGEEGTAIITVETTDKKFSATCEVEVSSAIIPTDGLEVWFSADDGVEYSGTTVSKWTSKVGDVTAYSGGESNPTYVEDAFGSSPGISFNGSRYEEYMSFEYDMNGNTEATIITVSSYQGYVNEYTDNNALLYFKETDGWGKVWVTPISGTSSWGFGTGVANTTSNTYSREDSIGTEVTINAVTKDGSTETLYVDGEEVMVATDKGTTITNIDTTCYICDANVGGDGVDRRPWYDVEEILIYDRALSEEEIAMVYESITRKITEKVTGLELEETEISILEQEEVVLRANVLPENASTTDLLYESSDSSVVEVSEDGVIKALSAGTADITVTTVDGGFSEICKVTVEAEEFVVDKVVLFSDDFSAADIGSDWVKSGTSTIYEISDEMLYLASSTGNEVSMDIEENEERWRNYSVEAEFTFLDESFDDGDYFALVGYKGETAFRIDKMASTDETSRIMEGDFTLKASPSTGRLELTRSEETRNSLVAAVDYEFEAGVEYKMKLSFESNRIFAYIAEVGEDYGAPVIFTEQSIQYEQYAYLEGEMWRSTGSVAIESRGVEVLVDNFNVETTSDDFYMALNKDEADVYLGSTELLLASNYPEGYADGYEFSQILEWSSSDPDIVSVDQEGNITALAVGEATITVRSNKLPVTEDTCVVTVYEVPVCETYLFVATDGDDSNPGTIDEPFATLEKARDTIREMVVIPNGGVTVYIRGGEYALEETFVLESQDSGTVTSPITYASYPGETAELVSKEEITGWELLEAGEVEYLPDDSIGNVYVADIPGGEGGERFHFLYDDGEGMPVAKQTQSLEWSDWDKVRSAELASANDESGRKITFQSGALEGLGDSTDIEVSMTTATWWNIICPISDIDEVNDSARMQSQIATQYDTLTSYSGGYYNITNSIKYLDEPGEWVVDTSAGKVYYWPEDTDTDINDREIFVPTLYELMRLQGGDEEENYENPVEHVIIEGITFAYTDRTPEDEFDEDWLTRNAENPDAMVFMQGVEDITFTGNTLLYSGSQGLALDHYADNVSIIGNEIAYSSSGGIQITGFGPGNENLSNNHVIQANNIHNVGQEYMHSNGLQIYGASNIVAEYNYIHTTAYSAVSIIGMKYDQMTDSDIIDTYDSFGNQDSVYQQNEEGYEDDRDFTVTSSKKYQNSNRIVIQYNLCDNSNFGMGDSATLYCWGSGYGKEWLYNAGYRIGESIEGGVSAIYTDMYDSYSVITGNIFGGENIGGYHDNSRTTNEYFGNTTYADIYGTAMLSLRSTIVEGANELGGFPASFDDSNENILGTLDIIAPDIIWGIENSVVVGDTFDATADMVALDDEDGDITEAVKVTGTVDTTQAGTYNLVYSVSDDAGNLTTQSRTITVVADTVEVVSKSELQSVYDDSKAIENDDYSDDSWSAFTEALEVAAIILADTDATQAEVDGAKIALETAIAGLEKDDSGEPGTDEPGTGDSGTGDSGTSDSGTTDEGTDDSGTSDSGTTDEGTTDEGTDAETDADDQDSEAEGDDSETPDTGDTTPFAMWYLFLIMISVCGISVINKKRNSNNCM